MKANLFTPDEHLRYLSEFIVGIQNSGGAVSHMIMAAESAKPLSYEEKLWRGGCYAATYNYASAEAIWMNFRPDNLKRHELVSWLKENWKGIPLRSERKAVRSPEKLADCLISYNKWSYTVDSMQWFNIKTGNYLFTSGPKSRYEVAWLDFISGVKYMARYIAIRYLEYLRVVFDVDLVAPDIRPIGAKFPRKSLVLMYPEYEKELNGGNKPYEIQVVNKVVENCKSRLKSEYNVDVDNYTLQVALCEYNKSATSSRHYPGRALDTELKYLDKVHDHFPDVKANTEAYKIRLETFPHQYLGELHNWREARKDLEGVLMNYRYTWDDSIYDYEATKDLGNPVKRRLA